MAQYRNLIDMKPTHHFTIEGMRLQLPPSEFKNVEVMPAKIDPFSTETSQSFPLGTILQYGDRWFRYALNGASSVAVARLVQAVVPLAGHIDEVCASGTAGSTTISFTPNTVTTDDMAANEFADGYLYINDDTGEGYCYEILRHPAITGGSAGTITLKDPIVVAIGATTTATVVHNRFRKFIIHPSPPTALLCGVTSAAFAANEYGWLQFRGPCPVLTDGTVVIGNKVIASGSVDGSVAPAASNGTDAELQSVGEVMVVNADTEESLVWLDIL